MNTTTILPDPPPAPSTDPIPLHRPTPATPLEIAGGFYDAYLAGDVAAAAAFVAPDAVLHVPGNQPQSGDHEGIGAILDFILRNAEIVGDGSVETELVDLTGGATHATAICIVTGERPGRTTMVNHTARRPAHRRRPHRRDLVPQRRPGRRRRLLELTMGDITIIETIAVDCPAHHAWAVVADYGRDPAWRRGVATMAPRPTGPVGVGTTTAEELRFAGQIRRNAGEVTAVDPGRSFRWRTVEGDDATGSRTVEPVDADHCRVTLELVVRPHGVEAFLAPVLGPMLRRTVRGDLTRLRELVQAAATRGSGAGTNLRGS